jgi:hypothetical protein
LLSAVIFQFSYRCDRLELGPVFGSFSCRLLCFYFYLLQENPAILQPSGNIEQGARFSQLGKKFNFLKVTLENSVLVLYKSFNTLCLKGTGING